MIASSVLIYGDMRLILLFLSICLTAFFCACEQRGNADVDTQTSAALDPVNASDDDIVDFIMQHMANNELVPLGCVIEARGYERLCPIALGLPANTDWKSIDWQNLDYTPIDNAINGVLLRASQFLPQSLPLLDSRSAMLGGIASFGSKRLDWTLFAEREKLEVGKKTMATSMRFEYDASKESMSFLMTMNSDPCRRISKSEPMIAPNARSQGTLARPIINISEDLRPYLKAFVPQMRAFLVLAQGAKALSAKCTAGLPLGAPGLCPPASQDQ